MRLIIVKILSVSGCLASAAQPVHAQYVLRSFTMNSGGCPMAAGSYRHDGSAGQASTGQMTGGVYQAGVGFWSHGYGPVSDVEDDSPVELLTPARSQLCQSYPNPFNPPFTSIRFQVGTSELRAHGSRTIPCALRIFAGRHLHELRRTHDAVQACGSRRSRNGRAGSIRCLRRKRISARVHSERPPDPCRRNPTPGSTR